jgi:hypothetical protein
MGLIFFAVGLAIGTIGLTWFAVPNIRQGRLLGHPLRLDELPDHVGELVVVHGRPEPIKEVFVRQLKRPRFQVLWQKTEHQEKVSSGRSSYWRTIRVKERKTDFKLHFPGGGMVYVYCEPSEVQDAGVRISGGGMTRGSTRSVQRWLPMVKSLTVMGELVHEEEGAAIISHSKHGLFFSPRPPEAAAKKELLKGWGGLAGAVACAAALAAVIAVGITQGWNVLD